MDVYVAAKAEFVTELLTRARAERGLPPAGERPVATRPEEFFAGHPDALACRDNGGIRALGSERDNRGGHRAEGSDGQDHRSKKGSATRTEGVALDADPHDGTSSTHTRRAGRT